MRTSREIERQDQDLALVHAVTTRSEDGTWTARCPELGITRRGGTHTQSLAQLKAAVSAEVRRRGPGWRQTVREVDVVRWSVDGAEDEDGDVGSQGEKD